MNINITLTLSKIFAMLLLGLATFFDIFYRASGEIFMWSMPFCVALITGKQAFDAIKASINKPK